MVKTEVLKTLENNKGCPVSGEAIATELGVSRTAVWKAINTLKKSGYAIKTINGKGYVLSTENDKISREGILAHIKTPIDIYVYEEVASTNNTAIGIANATNPQCALIVAEKQVQGKGRRGREFYSPKDGGIYLSLVVKPKFGMDKSILITTAASVAVMQAVKTLTGLDLKIKWVNDLFLDGKKVCGILTEAITDFESGQISHVVVGIGINCFAKDVPPQLKDIIGALNVKGLDRNKLIALICDNLLQILDDISEDKKDFLVQYREASMLIGQEINIFKSYDLNLDKAIPATAVDVDDNGGLVVKLGDGTIDTISTGEVSVRLK